MGTKKLYPDVYVQNITNLSVKYLRSKGIKGLILDMDNTLLNHKAKMKLKGLNEWIKKIKESGIKIVLVSNSIKRKKVIETSKYYDIPFIYGALKPLDFGFKKGEKKMKLQNNEIAVVGDQIFTDVLGANRRGMYSILVVPLKEKKESLFTRFLRIFERKILRKYLKEKDIKTKENLEKEDKLC